MITILNRIFPQDISQYIYNYVLESYIDSVIVGRIYIVELMMKKIIYYWSDTDYIYDIDILEFKTVVNIITKINNKLIIKNLYSFDDEFKNIIVKYCKIIDNNNKYTFNNLIKNFVTINITNLHNIANK